MREDEAWDVVLETILSIAKQSKKNIYKPEQGSFLWRERERAYQAVITPDCRVQCTGCGADKLYPGGKCDAEA